MIGTEGERGGKRHFLNISPGGEDKNQRGLGSQSTRCARGETAAIAGTIRSTRGSSEAPGLKPDPLVSCCVADQQEAVKLGASKRVDIQQLECQEARYGRRNMDNWGRSKV
jgi:hypothetical protein